MKLSSTRYRAWLPLLLLGLQPFAPAADAAPATTIAPELRGNEWLNVPPGTRLSLADRKGKVTLVHFWTFDCINCQRNLPFYAAWEKRFGARGLGIIGIHTPETERERETRNVERKVKELGITYPVLLDTKEENWRLWQQHVWPTIYLIDKRGRVRFMWEGELEYHGAGGNEKVTRWIETLLNEEPAPPEAASSKPPPAR